jgi:hypothetical protein
MPYLELGDHGQRCPYSRARELQTDLQIGYIETDVARRVGFVDVNMNSCRRCRHYWAPECPDCHCFSAQTPR